MGRTCAMCKDGSHGMCTKPATCRCDLCHPERADRDAELEAFTRERAVTVSAVADTTADTPPAASPDIPLSASDSVDTAPVTLSARADRDTARSRGKGGRPRKPKAATSSTPSASGSSRRSTPRTDSRKYDIPEDVRDGRQAYKRARAEGRQPNLWEVECNREYERLRWEQLTPRQRDTEIERNSSARVRRRTGRNYERTVRFPDGGSVTVMVNRELHELSDADRNFFLDLVGSLTHYSSDIRRQRAQVS